MLPLAARNAESGHTLLRIRLLDVFQRAVGQQAHIGPKLKGIRPVTARRVNIPDIDSVPAGQQLPLAVSVQVCQAVIGHLQLRIGLLKGTGSNLFGLFQQQIFPCRACRCRVVFPEPLAKGNPILQREGP